MRREMPELADRQQKMFCGGHSMGGPIMAGFTTWDFDGDISTLDDAGYNQCRGFFALDTTFLEIGSRFSAVMDGLLGPLTGLSYEAAIEAVRRSNSVFLEVPAVLDIPEIATLFAIAGQAAYSKPDEETDLFALLPDTPGITLPLRLLFSQDVLSFILGTPKLSDFRMTNEAALGTLFDDNSNPLFILQGSLGTFDGGAVVSKRFPFAGNDLIALLPGLGQRAAALLGGQLMMPAEPNGPLYSWRAYDRIDDPAAPVQLNDLGQPYTSPASEVTDIRQLARSLHEAPLDAFEAYFPTRLLLDTFFFFQAGIRSGDLAGAMHAQGDITPASSPYVSLQAGDGFATTEQAASATDIILPGYNHLDVATAAEVQNSGETEPTSGNLARFVLDNLEQ